SLHDALPIFAVATGAATLCPRPTHERRLPSADAFPLAGNWVKVPDGSSTVTVRPLHAKSRSYRRPATGQPWSCRAGTLTVLHGQLRESTDAFSTGRSLVERGQRQRPRPLPR